MKAIDEKEESAKIMNRISADADKKE